MVSSGEINILLLKARDQLLALVEDIDRDLQRLVNVRDPDDDGNRRVLVIPKTTTNAVGSRVRGEFLSSIVCEAIDNRVCSLCRFRQLHAHQRKERGIIRYNIYSCGLHMTFSMCLFFCLFEFSRKLKVA